MNREEILCWLRESDEAKLEKLWAKADEIRKSSVGDDVHLRGLVEISNYCVRRCAYCGLRVDNGSVKRYRMTTDEILDCAKKASEFGYGTLVMQSGEDPGIKKEWMADVIGRIKRDVGLAVTLSLGERSPEELSAWRDAGADRYLIRFETSNSDLFRSIHPPCDGKAAVDRISVLKELRKLGYEIGSGVMVGIPGQSYEDLASDLELFRSLDLDMIGVGPFIPHPETPLAKTLADKNIPAEKQVPNSELMTYKVMALSRILCPRANIPSTTALATINLAQGRELGLQRGANVLMPNITPVKYRVHYEIYPDKACINESADDCHGCMRRRIESIDRTVGKGPGSAIVNRRKVGKLTWGTGFRAARQVFTNLK